MAALTGALYQELRIRALIILLPALTCLLTTSVIHAQMPVPLLSVDNQTATAGFFHLNWETEANSFELQEASSLDFQNTTTLYSGPDRATVISGKPDGAWHYRVRASVNGQPGPWSDPVTVTVAHHNLSRAFMFLLLGFFVSNQLANGRRFRVLNVVDDFSRECMLQVADFSISGQRLARELDRLSERRPLLNTVVCDNGPELTSKAMFLRSRQSGVKLHFIQPGKPTRNAIVESFNGKFREYRLDLHWFTGLEDARSSIDEWRDHYNHVRPHRSLGKNPPAVFAREAT